MSSTKKRQQKPPRKEEVVNVRLTSEQKSTLENVAASEGLGVSTWLLHVGLRAAKERRQEKEER